MSTARSPTSCLSVHNVNPRAAFIFHLNCLSASRSVSGYVAYYLGPRETFILCSAKATMGIRPCEDTVFNMNMIWVVNNYLLLIYRKWLYHRSLFVVPRPRLRPSTTWSQRLNILHIHDIRNEYFWMTTTTIMTTMMNGGWCIEPRIFKHVCI